MLALTSSGRSAFEELTRELARRGEARSDRRQNFAIVLDDRILSVPFIDHRHVPDGIDGRRGMQISTADLTPDDARRIASLLTAGPLEAKLEPTR